MDIKAVILAAGKGTRMKSETTPKVLHQIMGKTLLGYVLDNVKNFVSEEYVIVGHHAQEVENFVKSNYENAKTVLQSPVSVRGPKSAPHFMMDIPVGAIRLTPHIAMITNKATLI